MGERVYYIIRNISVVILYSYHQHEFEIILVACRFEQALLYDTLQQGGRRLFVNTEIISNLIVSYGSLMFSFLFTFNYFRHRYTRTCYSLCQINRMGSRFERREWRRFEIKSKKCSYLRINKKKKSEFDFSSEVKLNLILELLIVILRITKKYRIKFYIFILYI